MKAREIKAMTLEERERILEELRTELMQYRAKGLANPLYLRNPGGARTLRRDIARILTVMREEG